MVHRRIPFVGIFWECVRESIEWMCVWVRVCVPATHLFHLFLPNFWVEKIRKIQTNKKKIETIRKYFGNDRMNKSRAYAFARLHKWIYTVAKLPVYSVAVVVVQCQTDQKKHSSRPPAHAERKQQQRYCEDIREKRAEKLPGERNITKMLMHTHTARDTQTTQHAAAAADISRRSSRSSSISTGRKKWFSLNRRRTKQL